MASTVLELNSEAAAWIIFPHWQPELPVKQPPIPEESLAAQRGCLGIAAHRRTSTWRRMSRPLRWSTNGTRTRTFLRFMTSTCRQPLGIASRPASGRRFSATGHDNWMPFRWIFQLDPTMWSDRVMDWRLISGAAYHSG